MSTKPHADDTELLRETSRVRFANIMFGTIGAGILFGLVGFATKALLDPLITTGFSLMPVLGLAGIAAVGIGCVYMGAKYLSKSFLLDQENQARKIAEASNGKEVAVEIPVKEPTRTTPIPSASIPHTADATPEQPAKQWAASVSADRTNSPDSAWRERVTQSHPAAAVTLH